MKTTELHRLVKRNGWIEIRQTESHVIYQKGDITYPVPFHGAKEVGKGLELKIRIK